MSAYPETMTGSDFCHVEGHLWRDGQCVRCYEQYRCLCGRFMRIEDVGAHFSAGCPAVPKCSLCGGTGVEGCSECGADTAEGER